MYSLSYKVTPLNLSAGLNGKDISFPAAWFGQPKGIVVIDFYVANEMLDKLVSFVSNRYDSLLHAAGVKDISYWVSELSPNNYPSLPVFQDKNLLVSIAFYNNEQEYAEKMKRLNASMDEDMAFTFGRTVTTRTTWVLYPTKRSFTAVASGEKSKEH